jgi:hypothetical protein
LNNRAGSRINLSSECLTENARGKQDVFAARFSATACGAAGFYGAMRKGVRFDDGVRERTWDTPECGHGVMD